MLNMRRAKKAEAVVHKEMQVWFRECLGCVAGRREYNLGRYIIAVIDDNDTSARILDINRRFRRSVLAYDKVACLLVFNNPRFYADTGSTALEAITYLAQQIAPVADTHPERLIAGGSVHQRHAIKCPVTGAPTIFDDFDAIAFCPQANNRSDPLYDPLMAAPYPCINVSSDIFAFSMFTRDHFNNRHKRSILTAPLDDTLCEHLTESAALWQRIALRTIRNYIAITDATICPTYLSADQRYWFASHQDPAFAESEKRLYRHEMPSTYAPEIVHRWKRRMQGHSDNRRSASITKPGESL